MPRIPNLPPTSATLLALPSRNVTTWVNELESNLTHTKAINNYLTHRAEVHDLVAELLNRQKEQMAARYNRGVKEVVHLVGDLAMLYQKYTGKLQPRWRGPFRISGYGGSHGRSFAL